MIYRSYKIRLPKISLIQLLNYASSTDALKTLGLPTLFQERLVHRYITTFEYVNGHVDHSFNILRNSESIVISLEEGTISVFLSLKRITESRDIFYQCAKEWNILDAPVLKRLTLFFF